MSLKKFVMSGIQDVLESKLGNLGGSQNSNQQQQQQPSSTNQQDFNMNPGGYSGSSNQGYPPQQSYGFNNVQGGEYPPQPGGFVNNQGYPPQPAPGNQGYPPQPGFGNNPGYPPQPGFGNNQGYPPQPGFGNQGYPPQSEAAHQGYPPQPGFGNAGFNPYPSSEATPQPQYVGGGGGYPPQQSALTNFYPNQGFNQSAMIGNPSLIELAGFNANSDAEALRKAMKGLGCNNSKVISVLCQRTNRQRQEISKAFKVMYGKDLCKELKGELHGDFEDLILALMDTPAVYDAKQLYKAMEGIGTKESVLIEIMTSRTNAQIQQVRDAYRALYRKELEKELIGETSGHFKRLLISLCAGGRDESNQTDGLRANQDARRLYQAGEKRLGTDESTFNAILASQNFAQLRLVFDEYQKISNHSIEKAIEAEFSGDVKDGLLAVIGVVRNRPAYFAKLLHESMKGLGTRDNDLIRLCVTRAEYDMADIRNAFAQIYKTSLENMIKGDCSGAYKEGLIALVKGNSGR